MKKTWIPVAALVAIAIVASACGADDARSPGTTEPATATTLPTTQAPTAPSAPDTTHTGPPSAAAPVDCQPDACRVSGVRFTDTMTLDEVRALAESNGAALVALWRDDAVCVAAVGSPPGLPAEPSQEPSAFAYVDADVIRAVQSQGPPATDGGWSLAVRDRFVEEWTAATNEGVLFIGAALLTHGRLDTGSWFVGVETLDWYLTDETKVLYLRGHDQQLAPLFDPPNAEC